MLKNTDFFFYVFNKRRCVFILFRTLCHPTQPFLSLHVYQFEGTIIPAGLLKPAPFWILLFVLNKQNVKNAIIATKMLQQNLIKESHINLTFSAYLLETHLPCTITWDTSTLHLYPICNPTLLFKPKYTFVCLFVIVEFVSAFFFLDIKQGTCWSKLC